MSSNRTDRALGRPPVNRNRAVAVGVVLAAALVAVAVVAVRDLAVAQGWASGEHWLAEALKDHRLVRTDLRGAGSSGSWRRPANAR